MNFAIIILILLVPFIVGVIWAIRHNKSPKGIFKKIINTISIIGLFFGIVLIILSYWLPEPASFAEGFINAYVILGGIVITTVSLLIFGTVFVLSRFTKETNYKYNDHN